MMVRPIDVVGRTADGRLFVPTIEYNVVEHCNLSCQHCDHASPLLPNRLITLDDFTHDLSALRRAVHASELKVIGGEPLLHPQLIQFLQRAREIGIADSITVATNGLLLHTMPDEFWRSVDCLWLSIYPGIRPRFRLEDVQERCDQWNCRLSVYRMDSFRQTLLDVRTEDPEIVASVHEHCELPWKNFCHTVRNGRYYKCSPSPFLEDRLLRLGIVYEHGEIDGVRIMDNEDLLAKLDAYLAADAPLKACEWCLGSSGPQTPHRQLSRAERASLRKSPSADHYAPLQTPGQSNPQSNR